jgi:hypothetical protein
VKKIESGDAVYVRFNNTGEKKVLIALGFKDDLVFCHEKTLSFAFSSFLSSCFESLLASKEATVIENLGNYGKWIKSGEQLPKEEVWLEVGDVFEMAINGSPKGALCFVGRTGGEISVFDSSGQEYGFNRVKHGSGWFNFETLTKHYGKCEYSFVRKIGKLEDMVSK